MVARQQQSDSPKPEEKPHPTEDIFRSDDALDIRWWFQCAAQELGFKSSSFVDGGGGGTKDTRCTLMPECQILAASRERRIHQALNALPAHVYHDLELAYSSPGFMHDDVGDRLGPYPALAIAISPFIQDGYRGHQRRFRPNVGKNVACPVSLELWIVKNVIKGKTDVAKVIKDDAEVRLAGALMAYREIRHPKSAEERKLEKQQAEKEKDRRLPKRSVAAEVAGVGYGK
jgi:hypothetical protein